MAEPEQEGAFLRITAVLHYTTRYSILFNNSIQLYYMFYILEINLANKVVIPKYCFVIFLKTLFIYF